MGTMKVGRPPKYGRTMTATERSRLRRERQRAAAAVKLHSEDDLLPPMPDDPAAALATWAEDGLKVPPGHPRAGHPMVLPDFGVRFLRDAMAHRESLLCVARKNAKSAIVAIYLLGRLVGPIATAGWRGAVTSITKQKAAELKLQMEAIATSAGLAGLRFMRSPAPGRVEGPGGRVLDILSADASSGHAAGFDDAIVDETGLLRERDRALINGLRSSVSARDGRMIHLSIWGDGPFIPELVEARTDPAVAVHLYQAEAGSALDDRKAWEAANPGLGTIKAVDYMRDRARLAGRNPNDAADFQAHDLNRPGSPATEMICTVEDWTAVAGDDRPPAAREGPCVIGLDAGGSASMTACCITWPSTGRVEVYGAFPADPPLAERGRFDGVGGRYESLHAAGELRTYPGRSTPVVPFLIDLADDLQGCQVSALGADRFRRSDVLDAISAANLRWPTVWRGQGASATADGSGDVRSFQKAVLERSIRVMVGRVLMIHAISESAIRRDPAGNPALDRARQRGRIDPLSAAVISTGLAERNRHRNRNRPRYRSSIA